MRTFDTGATRDTDDGKLNYEGFLSPIVLRRFAAYMHSKRLQPDGELRAADNWQKGMPLNSYMEGGFRHFMDWWSSHRYGEPDIESLCALMFNVMGYLHETLKPNEGQQLELPLGDPKEWR